MPDDLRKADRPPGAILHHGIWLPEHEEHLCHLLSPGQKRFKIQLDGRPRYQKHKLDEALKFIPAAQRVVAIDIGAHVGLWAMQLEEAFQRVECFEPASAQRAILPYNLRTDRCRIHPVALGESRGTAYIDPSPVDTGSTHLNQDGDGERVQIRTLDSFRFERVDFVKIDVEGYELAVVKGARRTLLRHMPVVVIEQKDKEAANFGREPGEAAAWLRELGMRDYRDPISGDHIMGWQ